MRTKNDLIRSLKPQYFWDVDTSDNCIHISRRLIIERVFTFGNLKEIKHLINYYGKEVIVEELCNLNYLDPKTLNFVSKLFDKPKKSFRCYTRKQLIVQYWNS
jgi:hypothetical protein